MSSLDNNHHDIDEAFRVYNQQFAQREPEETFDNRNLRGAPSMPPPNFTPEMPRSGAQPFSEDGNLTETFRGGGDPFRDLRRCLNRFTFIWLTNGNSYWFYPVFVRRHQVEGFRWRNGRWFYDRINLRRILFFRCF